jgi:hypothetical protein
VHVAVRGAASSLAYSSSRALEELGVKRSPAWTPVSGVVLGEAGALVQPLPEDAQADLAGRHVLHQVEHVVVAEEVGRLERRGLEAAAEGVAVLERDAQQVARAADGARRRLEQNQVGRVGSV